MYTANNEYEGTLLHFAVRAQNVGAILFLIESGAPLYAKDFGGRTPYELAAQLGYADIKELLKPLESPAPSQSER
jgi:ankyrin repeat protein